MIRPLTRWLAPAVTPLRVAIVGCGVSGAAAAIALIQRLPGPLDLVIADASGRFGPGFAYGPAARRGEILNVRARDLSIVPGRPDDFVDWLRDEHEADASPEAFLPRTTFGRYVEERLGEALRSRSDVTALLMVDEAIAVDQGSGHRFRLRFRRSPPRAFDVLFVATGYGTREPFARTLGSDPFAPVDEPTVRGARHALFVGSGLTMADALLSLHRGGFAGAFTVVSPRGLLPRSHTPLHAKVPLVDLKDLKSLSAVLRHVRRVERDVELAGGDWQGVANAVRSQVQDIWLSFSHADRQRFLHHLAPYWESIRHRLPPDQYAELDAAGPEVVEGRVLDVRPQGSGKVAVIDDGRGNLNAWRCDLVYDCTGYRPAVESPLVASLVAQGLAMIDPLRMGLAVNRSGRVRSPTRRSAPLLFAPGPLGRGSLYEITAVPQIVAQASQAAEVLSRLFAHGEAPPSTPNLLWTDLQSFT